VNKGVMECWKYWHSIPNAAAAIHPPGRTPQRNTISEPLNQGLGKP